MLSINDIFLKSALNKDDAFVTNAACLKWVQHRRNATFVDVELINFASLDNWNFEKSSGNLKHKSNRFFSIEGVSINTNWGNVPHWTQPIINQPEIGFLGFITKKINDVLHFLVQCKIEPGNINYVQLSPTLQATKSNYTKVHQGKSPLYLEYFNGEKKVDILLDQLQSEQGARFFRKRNRNIIIEVKEEIPIYDDFIWLTLGQIKKLMEEPNLINMDSRTVISGIGFSKEPNLTNIEEITQTGNIHQVEMLKSALASQKCHNNLPQIISWITALKIKYELEVQLVDLKKVNHWIIDNESIRHKDGKYFSVIGAHVTISNREVSSWGQPLVKSAQEGIIAFLVKKIDNIYHFLVQAKVEAGNFDLLELAPTVQCLTGNYRTGKNEYEVPFLEDVLSAQPNQIIYKTMQSEEGGRFFREQNLNMIVLADDSFSIEVPEMYCWVTLHQLLNFIQYNNYLNIQARSLIAAIQF